MKRYSIVIVGGGSTYTPALLKTLCDNKERFPIKKLVLFDIDEQRQAAVGEFARILFGEQYTEVEEIVCTGDSETAFVGIDMAFVQIRSGGFAMREKDEKISLRHGCVGQETCGAGGFAYGLRSIGDIIEIINNIRKYSPEAWILNYSNPAAIVAEATKREFPDDKRIINICDMPIAILEAIAGVLQVKRSDLEPRYFGLNHYGWFTHIYDKDGQDVLPKIKQHILKEKIRPADVEMVEQSWADTFDNLTMMLEDFPDLLPNTYMQYYLYPQKMVKKSNPDYTRANEVMDHREKRFFQSMREIAAKQTVKGSEFESGKQGVHGDYIIELAMSILNNQNDIFLIITKNNGAIPNFSHDAMVEIPCRVGSNGVEPMFVGEIPAFQKGLMEVQYGYERLTVDAFFENSYGKALQALVLNRTVTDTVTAKNILNDLIIANIDYWGKKFIGG